MYVALTGTPGAGKSSVSSALARRGHTVVDLHALAQRMGLLEGGSGGTPEVDLDLLARHLPPEGDTQLILVGHYAHLLDVGRAIVLRCHPEVLRGRLEARGWPPEKVHENVEAEAIDYVTVEALGAGVPTYEIDTTHLSPWAAADAVEVILDGSGGAYLPGAVDWSDVILSWY